VWCVRWVGGAGVGGWWVAFGGRTGGGGGGALNRRVLSLDRVNEICVQYYTHASITTVFRMMVINGKM